MRTGYKVIDAMTTRPITAAAEDSLHAVARLMKEKKVGSVLLKRGEELAGIVTEFDLVRKAMVEAMDVQKTPVSRIMTPASEMATAGPGMDVFDALNLMRELDVRHLPVLDDGNLVGFITVKDILRIEPELFDLIVDKYEIREAHRKPVAEFKQGECNLCGNFSNRLSTIRGLLVCSSCVRDAE